MREKINNTDNRTTYIIVDFEATCCDQESISRNEMEIIEIGAVAVDKETLTPLGEFQSFIRPIRNPKLTAFCKDLTSIKQEMVDDAPEFVAVLSEFKAWLSQFNSPIFCSWGYYDKRQLLQDCKFHNVGYPFTAVHINIKEQFARNRGLKKAVGLGNALNMVQMKFKGTAHRGIDDARNMALLSSYIFSNNPEA